jgi:signal transduction histidine kinase
MHFLLLYSTKGSDTRLGVTLCREIVEAHGGTLDAGNQLGGGVVVRAYTADPWNDTPVSRNSGKT